MTSSVIIRKLTASQAVVDHCERCGSLCDRRCRADGARGRAIDRAQTSRGFYR